ncbi:MAG: hypothetical protein ACOY3I_03670 [Verrucomicrobiota bacterium]
MSTTTQPSVPPPLVSRGKEKSSSGRIVMIILGILIGGFVCLIGLGLIGAGVYFAVQKSGNSTSEMSKNAFDYPSWRNLMMAGSRNPASMFDKESEPQKKIGFFAKWMNLPNDSAIQSVLKNQLPEGVKLKSFEPVSFEKSDDEIAVTYAVKLQCRQPLFVINAASFVPENKKDARLQRIAKYLILTNDLPAGYAYVDDSEKLVVPEGKTIELDWRIKRATKTDGTWHILSAEPLMFQKNAAFESRWIKETSSPAFIRSGDDLELAASKKEAALNELNSKIGQIKMQVDQFRDQAMSDVPGAPRDRKGGSGSGTPTKAGMGALAGAGAGAGLGAAAGGGDGAAIGAGAGAVAGLIGGYLWGRSDEEDELQKKRAARNRAKRDAQRRVDAFESQLWAELEQDLAFKAKEHNAHLEAGL